MRPYSRRILDPIGLALALHLSRFDVPYLPSKHQTPHLRFQHSDHTFGNLDLVIP